MKKPTKKELREMSDSRLLGHMIAESHEAIVYAGMSDRLPYGLRTQSIKASNIAHGREVAFRVEILRRTGGAK